jgi:hypothetical protein
MEGKNMSFFSNRILRWLAWSLVGLIVILMGIGLALQVITDSPFGGGPFVIQFSEALALSGFAIIGALIVSRQPRHPIGWIWIFIAISFGRDHFVWGYAYYGYVAHPGSLPGTEAAIVLLYFLGRGSSGMLGLTLLLLLFPTGRLLSQRWSPVAWIALGAAVITIPVSILEPVPIIYFPFPTDLLAVGDSTQNVLVRASSILVLLSLLCFMAAALSLFLRLVRSRGVERQQLKWFVSVAALLPVAFIFIFFSGSRQEPGFNPTMLVGAMLGVTASFGIAIASAIAIFRYRLWEIDIIIRRTLVYGILSSALLGIFLLSVILLQQAFRALTGQDSPFAIVISTLVIAALFNPLRWRVQGAIDRRFYRRKYDAQQALTAFSTTARDEVELEKLTTALLGVVDDALQPEGVSLWLKKHSDES